MNSARVGRGQTTEAQSPQLLVDISAKRGQKAGSSKPNLKTTAETPLVTVPCGATLSADRIGKIAMFQFVHHLRLRLSVSGTRLTLLCRLNSSAKLHSVTTPQPPQTAVTSCSRGAVMSSRLTPVLLILARMVCQLKQTQPGRTKPQPLLL